MKRLLQCFKRRILPRSPRIAPIAVLAAAIQSVALSPVYGLTGTIPGDPADAQVNRVGIIDSVSDATALHTRIGNNSADGKQSSVVHVFRIPDAILNDPSQTFDTATYKPRLSWVQVTTRTADLYGLGFSTAPTVLPNDAYVGPLDSASTLLKDNFLAPGMAASTTLSHSGASLVNYLNAQLAEARAGGASPLYVFFRTSPDSSVNWQFYQLGMADAGGVNAPTLEYSTKTAPVWRQVPLGGGGFVTGLASDSAGNNIYCRTDVGGVFRWVPGNGASGQWQSITDKIIPVTDGNRNAGGLLGIESFAVDPNNPNRLFVAGGRTAPYRGIFESLDGGATWTSITNAFLMEPNGAFKDCGERLAVDPNNSNILWFGSVENGLQKAVKSGSTWTWTAIPSTAVPFGQVPSGTKAGVTSVVCDKNGTDTIVYATVYDTVGATGGVYRLTNNGTNWAKVAGVAITSARRAHLAPNGTLYVSGNGIVAKLPRGGSLSAITPLASIPYCGITADPNDPSGNTVYAAKSDGNNYGPIWRSTNGGASWSSQSVNYNNYNGSGGWGIPHGEPDGTPLVAGAPFQKISALLVTPGNANELWCSDHFGVVRTQNASQLGGTAVGSQAIWYWLQRNVDETIAETMKVPPSGGKLMVGIADIGGFRYDDTTQRPAGNYGNAFISPSEPNVTSLDFCQSNPNIWVRSGVSNNSGANYGGKYGSGGYSKDGGKTWLGFGEIDRNYVDSGAAGWETWDLTKYLSLQKAKGVNTVTLVLSSGRATSNSGAVVWFASEENSDATLRPQLLLNGLVSVIPSDDAMVAGNALDTNSGAATTNGVSFAFGNTANERQIYLKFSLSGVSSISSAVLRMYRTAPTTAGVQFPIGVFACANASWVESTVTWNNRPKTYASVMGQPNQYPSYRTAAGLDLAGGRVAISATDPDRLVWMPFGYSGVPGFLDRIPHYSLDRGVTWDPCVGLPNLVNRLAHKSSPSYFLQQLTADRVNGQFYISHLASNQLYRSSDGVNWTYAGPISSGIYNIWRTQLVASPAANDIWYCDDGIDNPTNGGLWRSTNGGTSFTRISGNNLRSVRQVSFGKAPTGSASQYSVFVSGNYDVPGGAVEFLRGIYRSDDYGATWVALPAMPTLRSTESIAADPLQHGAIFVGFGGRGMFHYKP